MDNDISNRFYELRRKFGYSQEELADKLNVSRQAVSKWERGESSPDTNNLIALAKLYSISIDELLDYKPSIEQETKADFVDNTDNNNQSVADKTAESDNDSVNIYVNKDKYGNKNFHINDKANVYSKVYTYKSDNKEQVWEGTRTSLWLEAFRSFPYPVMCAIAYLLMGFLGNWWHPGWIIFITIPLYYGTIEAIGSGKMMSFPFVLIVVITYLLLGFLGNLWHPGWLIFLTIPLYYWAAGVIKSKFTKFITYPLFCTVVYLIIGFCLNIWHPTWIIFLTIPIYESIVNVIKTGNATKKERKVKAEKNKKE